VIHGLMGENCTYSGMIRHPGIEPQQGFHGPFLSVQLSRADWGTDPRSDPILKEQ
jgi:hypothetical protein